MILVLFSDYHVYQEVLKSMVKRQYVIQYDLMLKE